MSAQPVLIKKFGSYNIIEWDGNFHGIPLSAGPMQVDKEDFSKFQACFKAQSLKEVEQLIVNNRPLIQKETQPLLEETYGFYNIVVWGAVFYGIPKMGPSDLSSHEEITKQEGIFFHQSLPELKKLMEEYCRNQHKKNAGLVSS